MARTVRLCKERRKKKKTRIDRLNLPLKPWNGQEKREEERKRRKKSRRKENGAVNVTRDRGRTKAAR